MHLRLAGGELTKTPISIDERTRGPNHVIVQLTDPLLFRCPFVMMAEVGTLYFDPLDAANLRAYREAVATLRNADPTAGRRISAASPTNADG